MKILLLSRYSNDGASSRLRSYQYIKKLSKDFSFTISPFFSKTYLERTYSQHKDIFFFLEIFKSYLRRFWILVKAKDFDVIWIEKELFPYFPSFFENLFLKKSSKFIVDFDDAYFHKYGDSKVFFLKQKIQNICSKMDLVICGNNYLYEHLEPFSKNITVIPTCLDTASYRKKDYNQRSSEILKVCWIGTPKTEKYLYEILKYFSASNVKDIEFHLIGSEYQIPGVKVHNYPWSESSEKDLISTFDVGIMPLPDEPWERGKCGYKLLQYMSSGLPVIASPIGVNREIIKDTNIGFLATKMDEWEYALLKMTDLNLRKEMGENSLKKVEDEFDILIGERKLREVFNSII